MKKSLGIVVLSLSPLVLSGCGSSEPAMFDPKAIEQIQKQYAQGNPAREFRALPTTLPSVIDKNGQPIPSLPRTAAATGPSIKMTLREAIHRTVVSSMDVRVAGYQASIDEARILEAEAKFDPTLFVNPQVQRQFQQGLPPTTQPRKLNDEVLEVGVKQALESGGQVSASYKTTMNRFDVQEPGFPPLTKEQKLYDNQVILQVTQPLLRDFGTEVNRARITIAQNDQKISTLDFRDQLEKTLEKVEQTYWQLVFAQKDVEIQERLMEKTQDTLDILIKRLTNDTTMVQISQARAAVEQRNSFLVRARSRISELSDQLKRLMNDPEMPVVSSVVILPADEPVEQPVRFALSDQIEVALQNRLELLQQQLRISSARTVIKAAKNNELPQLNLQGQIGLQGLGADFGDALSSQGDGDFVNYSLGFQFELPIGNRQARAIYQRTLLQHQQAVDQYRVITEQVGLDVKAAQRELGTSWDEIIANRRARLAAAEALRSIDQRKQAGEPLTYNFVQLELDKQAALAEAARLEFQSVIAYNIAISGLEKAKGTLLRYNNVIMKEEKGPMTATIPGK